MCCQLKIDLSPMLIHDIQWKCAGGSNNTWKQKSKTKSWLSSNTNNPLKGTKPMSLMQSQAQWRWKEKIISKLLSTTNLGKNGAKNLLILFSTSLSDSECGASWKWFIWLALKVAPSTCHIVPHNANWNIAQLRRWDLLWRVLWI